MKYELRVRQAPVYENIVRMSNDERAKLQAVLDDFWKQDQIPHTPPDVGKLYSIRLMSNTGNSIELKVEAEETSGT